MIEPNLFATIELDTYDKSAGSPTCPDDWLGLLLRTPTKITIAVDVGGRPRQPVVIPVCGFHRLEVPSRPIDETEELIVWRDGDQQRFRGAVVTTDPSPEVDPPDMPPPTHEELAGIIVDTYFNSDLAALIDFPLVAGMYMVRFEFRGHASNDERFELVLESAT